MPLKMMYITNNTRVAQIVEKYGIDRVWVDLETLGKEKRQPNMNTVISNHVLSDVGKIRNVISKAQLMVRVNPINPNTKAEIDSVINQGADIVMLPFFSSKEEVKTFLDYVDGRAKTIILVETIAAEKNLDDILNLHGIDEVHIGLNDLHLQYHSKFMFELLANGKVEEMSRIIKSHNIPFGFGGIAKLDEGLLPARHIIAEHYRLGSSMVILSRSFCDSWIADDLEEIERVFKYEIPKIREYEERLSHETPAYFEKNRKTVVAEVDKVLERINEKM